MKLDNCPICNNKLENESFEYDPDRHCCWCYVCGNFSIARTALLYLEKPIHADPKISAILSHAIRKMQKQSERPFLSYELIENIITNNQLPSSAQQAENFILWLGNTLESPGDTVNVIEPNHFRAYMGALSASNFDFILEHLIEEGTVLDPNPTIGDRPITLSFHGWQKYEQIKRGTSQSRKAFMAMPFDDKLIESVFINHFKHAVEKTGFALYKLNEKPKAGPIDDRLRVEIITSRFLVADLTNGNHGVYWEAGYAEGLRKPVIYTCEKQYFEKESTHFDTNHLHTVIWDKENLKQAEEDLKITIRATLPDDAILEDE